MAAEVCVKVLLKMFRRLAAPLRVTETGMRQFYGSYANGSTPKAAILLCCYTQLSEL